MSNKIITCKDVMQHICESLGEELNSGRCAEIKKHIEQCSECKDYFKSVELTIDCYRKYNIKMPKDVHERLMKFLNLSDCE